jgi:hypothetical protein
MTPRPPFVLTSPFPFCGNDKRQVGLGIWLHINPVSCPLPNLPQFPVACYLSCGRRFRPGRAFYPTALIICSTFGRPLVEQLLWHSGCGSVSRTRLNPIRAALPAPAWQSNNSPAVRFVSSLRHPPIKTCRRMISGEIQQIIILLCFRNSGTGTTTDTSIC